jgi:DNA-binding response OmpR family regulator/ligand-binding sensor domain-containing protein/nitrogen-specific signal transduction histidine kinase
MHDSILTIKDFSIHLNKSNQMPLKYFFYINICLLFAIHAQGQEHFSFTPIDSNDGLSENKINCIAQLHDGRMVIITDGLVNLYDGTSFHYLHYNEEQLCSLTEYNGYNRTYVGIDGLLWIKNQFKLKLCDIRKESFVTNTDSVLGLLGVDKPLKNFFMDSDYNYWLQTTEDQLIYRNCKDGKTRIFLTGVSEMNGKKDILYDLAVIDKQVFLFYRSGLMVCYETETANELYRENPFGQQESHHTNTLHVVPYMQHLYQIRNGGNGGIMHSFNTKNRKWNKIIETDISLNTLTVDKDGNCWVSTQNGFWFIDKYQTEKRLTTQLQLVDGRILESVIYTQYNDKNGGFWLGTSNRGLLYYHPERFKFRNFGRTLFQPTNGNELMVYSFCRNKNQILAGTQQGLFQYTITEENHPTSTPLSLHPGIPSKASCSMLWKDNSQRIWVCTDNSYGLYCLDNGNVKHYTFPFHSIYFLYETFDGRFFLGTNQGFGSFDPQSGKYDPINTKEKPQPGTVYQLTEYGQDTLIGLSGQGVFIYDLKRDILTLPSQQADPGNKMFIHSNHSYNCLLIDSRGLTWFGTNDGINVWDPKSGKLSSFHTEDGLVNNVIKSIVEDHLHRIWLSTSNGISQVELIEKEAGYQYSFINFNRYDGVIAYEFLPRSVYLDPDGKLFWGGLDGFNEINYTQLYLGPQKLSTPLFIRFFLSAQEIKQGEEYNGNIILNQAITSTRELKLKHDQNFIGFELSALNYINPTQTFYRFKLEGVDNSWREITTSDGMGRINYTNLAPGTYILKVHAANNSREWNDEYAEMKIYISPPFWQTPAAYFIYLIFIAITCYLAVFYTYRKNKDKMKLQQKEELDQLKFRFFTNISHELRTPLTLILTPLDSVIKKVTDEKIKVQLEGIRRNSNNLLLLVNQLLDFRKLEMNGEKLNLSYCQINEFGSSISSTFEELSINKGIQFTWDISPANIHAYIDQHKLRIIINNLLSNAYKFTSRDGSIRFTVELLHENNIPVIRIQVSDTGCGIPEKELSNIFTRFYQVKREKTPNTGSGIGLHLVQEYVQLHNGHIEVNSEPDKGSTFTVYIPGNLRPAGKSTNELTEKMETGHPFTILIVEDNDEFRTFLCNELREFYAVIEASNGAEGYDMVVNNSPNLVISDFMMPEMNGLELCHKLKSNIDTSHIPVIILTARSSEKAQLEGYEAGADAYISKPFNMDILLLRIRHLIEQQEKRKELFKKALVINPESVTTSHMDEQLVKRALECIEKNMSNPNYSVEQFSKDMHMDRTGLYRKLVAIIGQTPTGFIRSVRLKRATLLLEKGISVSEVADQVGFGTVSYFSKCFQEEYHVKPSQFKRD